MPFIPWLWPFFIRGDFTLRRTLCKKEGIIFVANLKHNHLDIFVPIKLKRNGSSLLAADMLQFLKAPETGPVITWKVVAFGGKTHGFPSSLIKAALRWLGGSRVPLVHAALPTDAKGKASARRCDVKEQKSASESTLGSDRGLCWKSIFLILKHIEVQI